MMGAVFLGAAAASWWLGAPALGTALGILVAILALVAATTGFCAGCEVYRVVARLRGISPQHHTRLDPADLSIGGSDLASHERAYVEFTHPLCSECRRWEATLRTRATPLVTLDVTRRPDLARKYGVAIVPTVVAVGPDGTVLERLAP
jgi:hypothetical protein